MRFNYTYRTSDNARHSGVVTAHSKDDAYVKLKAMGIKPGWLEEAPGFLNKLFGKWKRWLAIIFLGFTCVGLLVVVWIVGRNLDEAREEVKEISYAFENSERRQIIGDAAVIEFGLRTGWANVFVDEGERFLASFAVPGVPAGLRSTSEAELTKALNRSLPPLESDSIEEKQIKAIVEGMKAELRNFIAGGSHTIVEYGNRLVQRQEQEMAYYNRAKAELEAASKKRIPQQELLNLWEKRNSELRRIGVKLIPMPE